MRIFKKLKTATMVSILIASFMFLFPGAGASLANGSARYFRSGMMQGYQNSAEGHRAKQVTRRVVTTRYYTPRSAERHHADRYCRADVSRHNRRGKSHMANNSFKRHQKLRNNNFRAQRHAQRHTSHNLGIFTALPGIFVNIPL